MRASMGAADVIRLVRTRFRAGWRTIDQDARRRWLTLMAVGIAGMFALTLVLVAVVKSLDASGALAWEEPFLRRLADDSPIAFSTAVWLQTFGTDITLWYLIFATAGIAVWAGRPITAASILLGYVVLDVVVRIGWLTWARERPALLLEGFASPGFHAFPSGHTGKTFVVYGLLVAVWVRSAGGWLERLIAVALLLLVAAVVPFSRMTMGVHWPTDLIGGWFLGAAWLAYLLLALRLERSASARAAADDRAAADPIASG